MTDREIKIEKGVPLPVNKAFTKGRYVVLDLMEIGDSFRLPLTGRASMISAIRLYRKRDESTAIKKFITRAVVEDDVKVLRVWRIK